VAHRHQSGVNDETQNRTASSRGRTHCQRHSAQDAEARDRLVLFTIGFVKLTVTDGVQDGSCAGSGTLVDVDGVLGTLTVAHLPNAL